MNDMIRKYWGKFLWMDQDEETKIRGRELTNQAIGRGTLVRPSKCDMCYMPCHPDAHHLDYTQPLDIAWLCPRCHAAEHRDLLTRRRGRT